MAQQLPTSSPHADTVLINGKIITVDREFGSAQALAIKNDRFIAVGTNDDVTPLGGADTRTIDLAGKIVVPGFIDTHGHIGLFGLETHFVPLDGARSIGEIRQRVLDRVKQTPTGLPIVTTPVGDHPYFFNVPDILEEKRFPNRWDLDPVSPEHPVYITAPTNRVPNSAVFNSAALRLAGITRDTPTWCDGIEVVKDPATGEPTGELHGMQPIYNPSPYFAEFTKFVPSPTFEFIRDGIRNMAPEFLAGGTTTLLEDHLTSPEELRAYAELQARGDLPLRIFYTFEIDPSKSPEELEEFFRTVSFASGRGFGTNRLMVIGVSLGLDGPHWHGTAVTGEPYPGPHGEMVNPEPLVPVDTYNSILQMAARFGFRIHAEAAGRGSIGIALAAMAEIDKVTSIRDRRFVLEHCEFPTKEQIAECKRLGVIPCTTTNFIWGKGAEVFLERLGREYAQNAIPLRWWLDAGVPVCQETDWGPHEALFTVWQSMARQAGLTGEVIGPEQRISREEAFRIFTSHGAYALGMEDELGSIEVGKLADLAILSEDPIACPEDHIKEIEVVATMVGGEIVHQRASL